VAAMKQTIFFCVLLTIMMNILKQRKGVFRFITFWLLARKKERKDNNGLARRLFVGRKKKVFGKPFETRN
jgi:hypothetical protein